MVKIVPIRCAINIASSSTRPRSAATLTFEVAEDTVVSVADEDFVLTTNSFCVLVPVSCTRVEFVAHSASGDEVVVVTSEHLDVDNVERQEADLSSPARFMRLVSAPYLPIATRALPLFGVRDATTGIWLCFKANLTTLPPDKAFATKVSGRTLAGKLQGDLEIMYDAATGLLTSTSGVERATAASGAGAGDTVRDIMSRSGKQDAMDIALSAHW